MTISTITIATVNYVSYASVAEADPYLAVDPLRDAAWAALTTDQKGAYLVAATRRLDLLPWAGAKAGAEDVQANAWPRTGVTYPGGSAVSTTEVPQGVEDATIILAGSIALDETKADFASSGSNVESVKAGSAMVKFFKEKVGVLLQDETAYQHVWPFLDASQGLGVGNEDFGTDPDDPDNGRPSAFEDMDTEFEVDRGYP